QGTYPVSLKISAPDGKVVLDTLTQNVVVKDRLVLRIGDSSASVEGNPDLPQEVNYIFGEPIVVKDAVWWDKRCHRSMNAASAQAASAFEQADPHVSVTYLNFACSGATINRMYYKDVSTFAPYGPATSLAHPIGTGILGPYAGADMPHSDNPELDQIPAQINQLTTTLTLNGPARQIDALILDGGGNDINFGGIAGICSLYYDCPTHATLSANWGGYRPLHDEVASDINSLSGRYNAL